MAIITISRQLGSCGNELCDKIAEKLNYRIITRKDIEAVLEKKGFTAAQFAKFDEKKPGFLMNLSKDRDEYLQLLRSAILNFARSDNCIFVGRGASSILRNIAHHISARIVTDMPHRIEYVLSKTCLDGEKAAIKRINTSDAHQQGFYKNFFGCDVSEPSIYHFVLNTGMLSVDTCAKILCNLAISMSDEIVREGQTQLEDICLCQCIVNFIAINYGLAINSLSATVEDDTITLHGIAESSAVVERALKIASLELSSYKIKSDIKVVQDYSSYSH